MSRTVLVLDGEQRSALAVVRSLGSAGHEVVVGSESGRSLAGASRHARRELRLPSPLRSPDGFVNAVGDAVSAVGAEVVLPMSEAALLALLPRTGSLRGALLPFPDAATFRAVCDKRAVLEAARQVGIAVPRQQVLRSASDVESALATQRFPIVIKPARSVAENGDGRRQLSVHHAADRAGLRRALGELVPSDYPVLLQERVVGDGVGIFLLIWDGEVVAQFAHRRLREKPPGGGVSVYRESIAADPDLVARSRALLDRFGWRGVAMVEYKLDVSGTPHIMEINGRFWGSLQLAIDAGVDFPRLLVECAGGRRPSPVREYRTGVRSRWWWGDVDQLLTRLRREPAELGLPPSAPSRLRALADFLVLWRPGDRSEILRAGDPRPFLRETLAWVAAARRAPSRKRRGASGDSA